MKYPTTQEEAAKYRYGNWAGLPRGMGYRQGDCAYEVWGSDSWGRGSQCQRKNGSGPAGLYCKQHAKKVEKP